MTRPRYALVILVAVVVLSFVLVWPAAGGRGGPRAAVPDPPPSPVKWSFWDYYRWDYADYNNAYETAALCYWYGLRTCAWYIHDWDTGLVDECNRLGRNGAWVHNEIIAKAEDARARYGSYGVVVHYTDPAHFYPTCNFGAEDVRTFH